MDRTYPTSWSGNPALGQQGGCQSFFGRGLCHDDGMESPPHVDELASALSIDVDAITQARTPAVFLDYDGTLTPIVDHPDDAVLTESSRAALSRLSQRVPVAIVSGRDRADVAQRVGIESLYYAGSHGFDITGPDGFNEQRGAEFRSTLRLAADQLEDRLEDLEGVWVERKRYGVAVHFRQAKDSAREVERRVADVERSHPALKRSGGKMIVELRPNLDWDKGRAVLWLLEALRLPADEYLPIYIGDDETDEDAFRALNPDRGIGIVVGESHRPTAAHYRLRTTEEVREFLAKLAEGRPSVRESDPPGGAEGTEPPPPGAPEA